MEQKQQYYKQNTHYRCSSPKSAAVILPSGAQMIVLSGAKTTRPVGAVGSLMCAQRQADRVTQFLTTTNADGTTSVATNSRFINLVASGRYKENLGDETVTRLLSELNIPAARTAQTFTNSAFDFGAAYPLSDTTHLQGCGPRNRTLQEANGHSKPVVEMGAVYSTLQNDDDIVTVTKFVPKLPCTPYPDVAMAGWQGHVPMSGVAPIPYYNTAFRSAPGGSTHVSKNVMLCKPVTLFFTLRKVGTADIEAHHPPASSNVTKLFSIGYDHMYKKVIILPSLKTSTWLRRGTRYPTIGWSVLDAHGTVTFDLPAGVTVEGTHTPFEVRLGTTHADTRVFIHGVELNRTVMPYDLAKYGGSASWETGNNLVYHFYTGSTFIKCVNTTLRNVQYQKAGYQTLYTGDMAYGTKFHYCSCENGSTDLYDSSSHGSDARMSPRSYDSVTPRPRALRLSSNVVTLADSIYGSPGGDIDTVYDYVTDGTSDALNLRAGHVRVSTAIPRRPQGYVSLDTTDTRINNNNGTLGHMARTSAYPINPYQLGMNITSLYASNLEVTEANAIRIPAGGHIFMRIWSPNRTAAHDRVLLDSPRESGAPKPGFFRLFIPANKYDEVYMEYIDVVPSRRVVRVGKLSRSMPGGWASLRIYDSAAIFSTNSRAHGTLYAGKGDFTAGKANATTADMLKFTSVGCMQDNLAETGEVSNQMCFNELYVGHAGADAVYAPHVHYTFAEAAEGSTYPYVHNKTATTQAEDEATRFTAIVHQGNANPSVRLTWPGAVRGEDTPAYPFPASFRVDHAMGTILHVAPRAHNRLDGFSFHTHDAAYDTRLPPSVYKPRRHDPAAGLYNLSEDAPSVHRVTQANDDGGGTRDCLRQGHLPTPSSIGLPKHLQLGTTYAGPRVWRQEGPLHADGLPEYYGKIIAYNKDLSADEITNYVTPFLNSL